MPEQSIESKASSPASGVRADALATRIRILAAAEGLFAERGIDATTLADVNKAADQRNRSAVQYHFGGKEGLIHAILDKHTPGIETRRQAMLDSLEAARVPGLRGLIEALVLPIAEKLDDPDGGRAFLRVNAQLIGHPRFSLLELHSQRENGAADRLNRLIVEAAPNWPEKLNGPRWLLLLGLLFHGLADYAQLLDATGVGDPPGRALFVSNLVDSIMAILEAPVSGATALELERA